MERNIYHSAEGSTWTKKNHKYIRKEGNRYIYPEDVNKNSSDGTSNKRNHNPHYDPKIRGTVDTNYHVLGKEPHYITRVQAGTGYKDVDVSDKVRNGKQTAQVTYNSYPRTRKFDSENYKGFRKLPRHRKIDDGYVTGYSTTVEAPKTTKRQSANSNQSSPDYKNLSQQHANRMAAANGQVVNPIATWRGSNGQVIAREKTNEKISSPTTADYKQYSKERSNGTKRKAAAGSPNEYVRNQEHAKKMTMIRHAPSINPIKYKNGVGPSPDSLDRRINAMKKQGTVNHQQEAKDFKEYRDWERADAKKRDSEPKRKAALNNQGKNDRQDQTKHTLYEKRLVEKVEKEQKETEKPIIEKKEKETILKEQSPSENKSKKKTNKALEKGKKALDAIKSKLSKKKGG